MSLRPTAALAVSLLLLPKAPLPAATIDAAQAEFDALVASIRRK